jgi:hypothetical protein
MFSRVERFLPADVVARLSGQFNFIHVGDQVSDDMGELVSVLSACDHAISVDNSTAHLAGALGLPISLMLTDGAAGGEWRWHCVGRDRSPWYPSARIFRRTEHGDWSTVVGQVSAGFCRNAEGGGVKGRSYCGGLTKDEPRHSPGFGDGLNYWTKNHNAIATRTTSTIPIHSACCVALPAASLF